MCLLTYLPPGILPNIERLSNGALINDDGHGYAIITADNELFTVKGMDASEVLDRFMVDRLKYPEGPAIFHSRYATDGTVTEDNIHPFTIAGDELSVVAHNGVLPLRPMPGDSRSDTAILADTMIKRFGSPRRHKAQRRLMEWMGTYNKLVVLSVNPRFRKQAIIINERAGSWVDGIWYSNEGYQGYRKHWFTGSYKQDADSHGGLTWWEDAKGARDRDCFFCGARLNYQDNRDETCSTCRTCLSCGMEWTECNCLIPADTSEKPMWYPTDVGSASAGGVLYEASSDGTLSVVKDRQGVEWCDDCGAMMWLCQCH